LSTVREEIYKEIEEWDITRYMLEICVNDIIAKIEKRINEKIQHVNEVLEDPRMTIQGCQRLKGRRDAFEEMNELLNK
jgi:hypothetical protein